MDIFGFIAILYLAFTVIAIYYFPEIIISVQLFSTPIFGLALKSLGLGLGSINTIFGLTLISLFLYSKRNKNVKFLPTTPIEIAMIALILWVATTLVYTPSPNYGTYKLLVLIIVSFPCIYMARLYCSSTATVKQVFVYNGWYAIAALLFYASFIALDTSDAIRIRSSFFGPLTLGYIAVTTIPFIFSVTLSAGKFTKLITVSFIPCAVYVVVATGSRGPILALIIATILSLVRFKYFFRVFAGLSVAAAGAIIYIIAARGAGNKSVERILGEAEGNYRYNDGRLGLYPESIDQFLQHPFFGQGIGSFSYFVQQRDTRYYPHNSFFEIAGELGLVGLILIFTVVILCFIQILVLRHRSLKRFRDQYWTIAGIQALFFAGLLNACFSFDFPVQRILFVSIGLLAATLRWKAKPKQINVRNKKEHVKNTVKPNNREFLSNKL